MCEVAHDFSVSPEARWGSTTTCRLFAVAEQSTRQPQPEFSLCIF